MFIKRIRSIFTIARYKIKYGTAFKCDWSATIAPSFLLRLVEGGKVVIGQNVEIRENVIINVSNGGIITLGEETFLNDFCCINAQENVEICKGCQLGQGVKIYDHDHDYRYDNYKYCFVRSPVILKPYVWVGSNAVILRGSIIGERSILGAGTVIKKSIPPKVLCYSQQEITMKSFNNIPRNKSI